MTIVKLNVHSIYFYEYILIIHTLLELNMANRPTRFFSLPADMVPLTVIDSARWAPMPDDT